MILSASLFSLHINLLLTLARLYRRRPRVIIFICLEESLWVQNGPWHLFFEFLCHFLIVSIGSGASDRLGRCLGALRRHLGDRSGALRLLTLLLICGFAAACPILIPYFGQKKHDTINAMITKFRRLQVRSKTCQNGQELLTT